MAKWLPPAALAFICVAHAAAAQGARDVQPDRRLRGPATFKTNECVVNLNLDDAGAARPSGETTVLIDDRYRLTLRLLPRISGEASFVTFVPHNFLCDGRTHKVELTWGAPRRSATYQTFFPRAATWFPFSVPVPVPVPVPPK